MSSGRRGRGRGGSNPLATPFNPRSQPPTSPDDTQMEEDTPSPIQTVATHTSSSVHDGEPTTLQSLQEETNALINQNKQLADCYQYLQQTFEALEKHLILVQERHIEDTQDLKNPITNLTKQLEKQQDQQPVPAPTTASASIRPIAPLPTLTWAQKAARAPPAPTTSTTANKKTTPLVLTKRDRTIVIERDGTSLPDDTNALTIRDALNAAIKKPLIATIEFTTNHHVLLLTKDNTPATSVLKSHRSAIEEAIRATIPAAIGLRKDEIWHKVILHGIPTTATFATVQSEVEEFNPGIQLPRPPRWLTTEVQRQHKAASAMVLTIAGKD